MKYPSVFLTLLFIWFVLIVIALVFNQTALTYKLYLLGIATSIVLFIIGFWRNT